MAVLFRLALRSGLPRLTPAHDVFETTSAHGSAPSKLCLFKNSTKPRCSATAAQNDRVFPSLSLLSARAWVRLVVNLREVLKIEMRVDLGGADVGVAEEFLHGAQVAARFQ
jgi:hypothetical protein